MRNLVGMDTFHATTWLGRNAINYEIVYGYSDKYDDGTVIKQSITKGKIIDKESSNVTRGHRFAQQNVYINNPDDYVEIMRNCCVIVDQEERRQRIIDKAKA